jgi:hypothetical protein
LGRDQLSELSDLVGERSGRAGQGIHDRLPGDWSFEFIAVSHSFHRHADVVDCDLSIAATDQLVLNLLRYSREYFVILPHCSEGMSDLAAEWANRYPSAKGGDLLGDLATLAAEHLEQLLENGFLAF